jgi:cytochrome c oxidase subunit 4
MVGWYFMHLKFEGTWVYCMLVPASILAVILTCALIPDVVLSGSTLEGGEEEEEAAEVSLQATEIVPWTGPIALES